MCLNLFKNSDLAADVGKEFFSSVEKFFKDSQIINKINDRANSDLFCEAVKDKKYKYIADINEEDLYDEFVDLCCKSGTYRVEITKFVDNKFSDKSAKAKTYIKQFLTSLSQIIFEVISEHADLNTKLLLAGQETQTKILFEELSKVKSLISELKPELLVKTTAGIKISEEEKGILHQWYDKFNIKSWITFTENLLRPYAHFMKVEVYENFLEARFWLDKNIHLIVNKNCKEALCNFSAILQKLLSVYIKHADEKYDGIFCTKPNKYGSDEYAEYDNYNGYQKHNDLIWELTFELTKSTNAICDFIRDYYCCDFAKEKVGLRCSTNIIEGYYDLVVEYKEGEVRKFDFNSFIKDDSKRLWKDSE